MQRAGGEKRIPSGRDGVFSESNWLAKDEATRERKRSPDSLTRDVRKQLYNSAKTQEQEWFCGFLTLPHGSNNKYVTFRFL